MSSNIITPFQWQSKPPLGTKVLQTSNLSKGLFFCVPFSNLVGNPSEIISKKSLILKGTTGLPSWSVDNTGLGLNFTASNTQYITGPKLQAMSNWSIVWESQYIYNNAANIIVDTGNDTNSTIYINNTNSLGVRCFSYTTFNFSYKVDSKSHVYCITCSNGSLCSLYVDGNFINSVTLTSAYNWNSKTLTIGASNSKIWPFNGTLYNLYIYNRCLDSASAKSVTINPWQIFQPQIDPAALMLSRAASASGPNLYSIPISFDAFGVVVPLVVKKSQSTMTLAEQTDLSGTVITATHVTNIAASLPADALLTPTVVRRTYATPSAACQSDLTETVVKSSYTSVNIAAQTDLSGTARRNQLLYAAPSEQSDFTASVARLSSILANSTEQTDISMSYGVISPLLTISPDLQAYSSLSAAAGLISPFKSTVVSNADVQSTVIRRQSLLSNPTSASDYTVGVIRSSSAGTSLGSDVNESVTLCRKSGVTLDVEEESSVQSTVILIGAPTTIHEDIPVYVEMLVSVIKSLSLEPQLEADSYQWNSVVRRECLITQAGSETSVDFSPGLISCIMPTFDTITLLDVSVGGSVHPVEIISFTLSTVREATFTLPVTSQLQFTV